MNSVGIKYNGHGVTDYHKLFHEITDYIIENSIDAKVEFSNHTYYDWIGKFENQEDLLLFKIIFNDKDILIENLIGI